MISRWHKGYRWTDRLYALERILAANVSLESLGCAGDVWCCCCCRGGGGGGRASVSQGSTDALTLVDNNSAWGTYVVSSEGTRKAPAKVTAGIVLSSGLLVCIGVCKDGPPEISATEANQACVVYRVRCMEQEAV